MHHSIAEYKHGHLTKYMLTIFLYDKYIECIKLSQFFKMATNYCYFQSASVRIRHNYNTTCPFWAVNNPLLSETAVSEISHNPFVAQATKQSTN